ncbi:MAG: Holliday junction resolvase RuvX [Alphaproteobacteria bacterium]|nr:Holliday junction resolvase RuvX [Alphaproteobacteria bacterium]
MPICNLAELKSSISPGQRLMGLDHGTKTLGLALSDVLLMVASPFETIMRVKFTPDAKKLLEAVDKQGVGGLVIGLPVEMDGGEGPRCQSVRQFAANLMELQDLPIAFWDERLSTSAVERMMINEADISRKKRAGLKDKLAAVWILQGALDSLSRR